MRIIGLMSGTSCDGLDLVCVDFEFSDLGIRHRVMASDFVAYSADWQLRLRQAHLLPGLELYRLDVALGQWMGVQVRNFIAKNQLSQIAAVASHGHTIFHEPEKGLTLQIGNGAHIKQLTELPVICDFRTQDVANHGQGAPLVPIGDALLFNEFSACLNLGGFSNISFEQNGQRLAFDICPVNIVLDKLAAPESYDKGGEAAKRGTPDQNLLFALSELPYYKKMWPKSLGREWVDEHIWPLFDAATQLSREDKLTTFSLHVVDQLQHTIRAVQAEEVLVTGGGAYNNFIIDHLRKRSSASIVVPENNLVDFKEAIVFALLGALRWRNEINVLATVTGGCSDISAGVIYR